MKSSDTYYRRLATIAVIALVLIAIVLIWPAVKRGGGKAAEIGEEAVDKLDPDYPWIEAATLSPRLKILISEKEITRWTVEEVPTFDGDESRRVTGFYNKSDGTEGAIVTIFNRTGDTYDLYSYTASD